MSIVYDPAVFGNTAYRLVINDDETLEQMLEILNLISPVEYTIQGEKSMEICSLNRLNQTFFLVIPNNKSPYTP